MQIRNSFVIALFATVAGCADADSNGVGSFSDAQAGEDAEVSSDTGGDSVRDASLDAVASDAVASEAVEFCDSERQHVYDPGQHLTSWPDDEWTVADAATRTGLRLALDSEAPAFARFPEMLQSSLQAVGDIDGFATSALLYQTVSTALPANLDLLDVQLLTQGSDGTWQAHAHTRAASEDGTTLYVRPWQPLPPGRRGVFAVHRDTGDGTACISPAALLRERLTDPLAPLHDRYAEALDALDWTPQDVGMLSVFTTQSAGLDDQTVLDDVDNRSLTLDGPMNCEPVRDLLRCEGTVTVGDYRDPTTGVVPAAEPLAVRRTYALPVTIWVPDDGQAAAPYPVMFCGHHLGGNRAACGSTANQVGALGVATIAVDAQEHGDHPARTSTDPLATTLALTGIELDPPGLNPLVMRDNMRASAWDKLQVLRALQAGWDLDGDGSDDLDGSRVMYSGVSLGGVMSPQFLALAPEIEAAVLAVPGGGLAELFVESEALAIIAQSLVPPGWTDDDLARALPILQAVADAGDPLVFAQQISQRRTVQPQLDVVMVMALDDTIVPNSSTTRLTQAFGLQILGRPLLNMPGVQSVDGPVGGNLIDGATGILLQLDEVERSEGSPPTVATHLNLSQSEQWRATVATVVRAWLDGAAPEIGTSAVMD